MNHKILIEQAKTRYARYGKRAVKFFATQLCVTLISWPLMLEWGLPVSILSPLGNAIFNPFVSAFLALCALITGAEILHIPHAFLDISLEKITAVWLTIIKIAPPGLVLTLQKPPLILSLCAPIGTILIMHCRAIRGILRKIAALGALFVTLTIIFALLPQTRRTTIPYASHSIPVYRQNNGTLLAIDAGFVRRTAGMENWVTFTLLPELSIHFGRQVIDQYVCKKLTPATEQLMRLLCEKQVIRALTIPSPTKKESIFYKKMREDLEAVAHQYHVAITTFHANNRDVIEASTQTFRAAQPRS